MRILDIIRLLLYLHYTRHNPHKQHEKQIIKQNLLKNTSQVTWVRFRKSELHLSYCENWSYLMPPTKIRFGMSVPYFGAANCASSCPFGVFVTAILMSEIPEERLLLLFFLATECIALISHELCRMIFLNSSVVLSSRFGKLVGNCWDALFSLIFALQAFHLFSFCCFLKKKPGKQF